MVFNHSVKVPTQYKKAAKVLEQATQISTDSVTSLKDLIFSQNHVRTGNLYALFKKLVDNKREIDVLIEKSKILENESRLNKSMCYVLVTELMYGAGLLNGESKPVTCVRSYKEKFDEILSNQLGAAVLNAKENEGLELPSSFSQKPRYVRINTNILSREEALEEFRQSGWFEKPLDDVATYSDFLYLVRSLGKFEFCADLHVDNLFVFPASSKRLWAMSPLVAEAKVFLQDKASCLPASLLAPPPRSCVLDMCAAPGMKTTHLSSVMKNRGIIYAIEQHNRRFETLTQMVDRANCKIVQALNGDALQWTDEDTRRVEYILVDPSCSGSGMVSRLSLKPITKSKDGKEETYVVREEADRLYKLAGLQIKMLCHALQNFPEAKKVVYSTCSLFKEENEEVVQRSLARSPGWKLVKPFSIPAFGTKENPKWNNFGSEEFKKIGKRVMYCRPEDDLTDGFFVALFERENLDQNEGIPQHDISVNPFKSIDDDEQQQSTGNTVIHLNTNGMKKVVPESAPEVQEIPVETKEKRKKSKKMPAEDSQDIIDIERDSQSKKLSEDGEEVADDVTEKPKNSLPAEKKIKKRKSENEDLPEETQVDVESEKPKKKKKKSVTEDDCHSETPKKSKKKRHADETLEESPENSPEQASAEKKLKKKKRSEKETRLEEAQVDDESEKPKKKKKKNVNE